MSYAAIFGIKKDLHLSGEEYSWLSSLFYFGWLGWALGTNYLMSQFPVAKFLVGRRGGKTDNRLPTLLFGASSSWHRVPPRTFWTWQSYV